MLFSILKGSSNYEVADTLEFPDVKTACQYVLSRSYKYGSWSIWGDDDFALVVDTKTQVIKAYVWFGSSNIVYTDF